MLRIQVANTSKANTPFRRTQMRGCNRAKEDLQINEKLTSTEFPCKPQAFYKTPNRKCIGLFQKPNFVFRQKKKNSVFKKKAGEFLPCPPEDEGTPIPKRRNVSSNVQFQQIIHVPNASEPYWPAMSTVDPASSCILWQYGT